MMGTTGRREPCMSKLLKACISTPVAPDPVLGVGPVQMAEKWHVHGSLDVILHSQFFLRALRHYSAHLPPFVSSFFGSSGFVFASISTIAAIPSAFALFASSSAGSVSVSRPPKSQSSCSSRMRLERSCAARIYVFVLAGELILLPTNSSGGTFGRSSPTQSKPEGRRIECSTQ
jgi:hypothetical protein